MAGLCAVLCVPACAAARDVLLLTDAFTASVDATKNQTQEARVADFRQRVAARFPAFYEGQGADQKERDRSIAQAIDEFPAIREAYQRKAGEFESTLGAHLATFQARFPDFRPTHEIVVLHSLGEMDGGLRTLDGKNYLIFGMDVMARRERSEAAFFHHELFHTYHMPALVKCDGGMWMPLWSEGLASHVAKVLNPGASEAELLFDIPAGMAARTRARLGEALRDLEQKLDSEDVAQYHELFTTGATEKDLPVRRGYYLGYLVAEQAAKGQTLEQLVSLDCKSMRATVGSALRALIETMRP